MVITKEDIEFIKSSFHFALDRMQNLEVHTWGSYDMKIIRINEVRKKQEEILKKLNELK